ncbi:MAG: translation initiation factor IF-3 [Oceanibaculum nanhaiense]|uniref:translation initiation factor IF-3 n=1 Tax=Oceanibaculum nanhaiense TaxID=1909734 RepID=UPI0025A3BAAC|nr:translation initiation factor IF-3 [Oceanibaculum nanhaiense]MDM7946946.1 translation initiation factor IF-3 [Oceanibaculum nanhaiense]
MARFQPDAAPSKDGPRVNEDISSDTLRVIGENGENLGVMSRRDALRAAEDVGLDLVEISPGAAPPVVKILDYGKFKYEAQKKRNEARKNQKIIDVKEIKMRPNIDDHDYDVKMRSVNKFLTDGDKVKVTMRFRGREMAHQDIGMNVLMRVKDDVEELAKVEQYPKLEGRQMVMVIAPR